MAAAKKSFSDLFSSYKTYDPTIEGYGTPVSWSDAFGARMGLPEAKKRMEKKDCWQILGITRSATMAEAKSAFRKLVLLVHPDRAAITGLSKEESEVQFKELLAAWTIVESVLS